MKHFCKCKGRYYARPTPHTHPPTPHPMRDKIHSSWGVDLRGEVKMCKNVGVINNAVGKNKHIPRGRTLCVSTNNFPGNALPYLKRGWNFTYTYTLQHRAWILWCVFFWTEPPAMYRATPGNCIKTWVEGTHQIDCQVLDCRENSPDLWMFHCHAGLREITRAILEPHRNRSIS